MKVLLINGSSNENGCTFTALNEISLVLNHEGIESEIIQLGAKEYNDCIGCGLCRSKLNGKCIYDDIVNELIEKAKEADGFIFGSPVYYAHPSGRLISVLDRLFFAAAKHLAHKPAAAIVSARRAGTSSSLDVIQKYFLINQMPVISSSYWNMVHGSKPEDVLKDKEGLQTMHHLAKNMAYYLKLIQLGQEHNIIPPQNEKKEMTNFIR